MPFEKGIKVVWMNILQYRIKHFEQIILMEQGYHSPYITEKTIQLTNQLTAPLFLIMERGKQEGFFKKTDSFTLLTFMIGSIQERVKHAHYNNTPLTKPIINQLFTMCWDGLTLR